jgi:hypothetical protein
VAPIGSPPMIRLMITGLAPGAGAGSALSTQVCRSAPRRCGRTRHVAARPARPTNGGLRVRQHGRRRGAEGGGPQQAGGRFK